VDVIGLFLGHTLILLRMKMTPFKNRKIDLKKPVRVYRNVRRIAGPTIYSVVQNGLVIGHTNKIVLRDCVFKVNESGRNRVRKEKVKNVHAWIEGNVTRQNIDWSAAFEIKYNPYENDHFTAGYTFYIGSARQTWIGQQGVFANGIVEKGIS